MWNMYVLNFYIEGDTFTDIKNINSIRTSIFIKFSNKCRKFGQFSLTY